MKETLSYLIAKKTLSFDQARHILTRMGKGEFSEPEIAAFLMAFLMREITPDELGGFREALLDLCVAIDLNGMNTLDVCGTGGDEKNTFNISTLSAFVLAGAGVKVVKHGNYAVSSACGSSNIFEHFGYRFSNDPAKIRREVEEVGICYLHAPLFHPAMKYVGPVRKALRLKTFFNLLGPMVNPTRPKNQLIGVFSPQVIDLYHQVYARAGINHVIIHSNDGYDEISLTGAFQAAGNAGKAAYVPADLGLSPVRPDEIYGGETVEEAAFIFRSVLEGQGTRAQTDVVVANSALALQCYRPELSLADSVAMARESIASGKALKKLEKLISLQ